MSELFISYSRKDNGRARRLAKRLAARGFVVWWDNLLTPGAFFNRALTEKINSSAAVVVLWSSSSVRSQWVIAEANAALGQNKLVPVKLRELNADSIPLPFNSLHTIDDGDLEHLCKTLLEHLAADSTRRRDFARRSRLVRLKRASWAFSSIVSLLALAWAFVFVPGARELARALTGNVKGWIYPCRDVRVVSGKRETGVAHCVPATRFSGFTFQDCEVCPKMVLVPSGVFDIGSPESELGRDVDEGPRVKISVDAFAIGQYEVTRKEWHACVLDGKCKAKTEQSQVAQDRHPIAMVSWDDAQDYVNWLSALTGHTYRLPSEAEWEYAARAGEEGPRPWGFPASEACNYANVGDESFGRASGKGGGMTAQAREKRRVEIGGQHPCDDSEARLAPVGSYKPNRFRLYDMIGNVWEWVADCAFPDYQAIPRNGLAYREAECKVSTLRGGSFVSGPASARSANRFQGGRDRSHAQPDFGLRIVRELRASGSG